ncbi:sodium-dependent lysophosphatidylcholine symporter 1-B-like [Glandiceps talaboti]
MDSEKIEEEQPLLEKENGTTATVDNKPLSTLSRLCYGIGGIPTMMPTVAMNAYLSLFLLEVAMIHPTYASVVIFTGRAWEAVGNPVIGVIINKLDSRFGKMKPWIVCTLPVLMLSYFLTWVVPDVNEDIKFVYYLFIQCTYLTCLATFNLPYMSLIMYLSNDQQERDSATVYRMVCSLCGTVIGSVIMSLFLATVEQGDSFVDPCVNITQTVTPTLAPEYLDPMKIAFMAAAGTFISVILVCGLVLIFGTKEKKGVGRYLYARLEEIIIENW